MVFGNSESLVVDVRNSVLMNDVSGLVQSHIPFTPVV